MKKQKFISFFLVIMFILFSTSCNAIGSIFKTGADLGILLVITLIAMDGIGLVRAVKK